MCPIAVRGLVTEFEENHAAATFIRVGEVGTLQEAPWPSSTSDAKFSFDSGFLRFLFVLVEEMAGAMQQCPIILWFRFPALFPFLHVRLDVTLKHSSAQSL